ncbi:14943_t:CDS:2, partial [Racocetra persica]
NIKAKYYEYKYRILKVNFADNHGDGCNFANNNDFAQLDK